MILKFIKDLAAYEKMADEVVADEKTLEDIRAFSDGCVATAEKDCPLKPYYGDNVSFQKAVLLDETDEKLKSPVLYGTKGNTKKYISAREKSAIRSKSRRLMFQRSYVSLTPTSRYDDEKRRS